MTVPRLAYPAHLLKQLRALGPADRVEQRLAQLVGEHYKDARVGYQEEGATHREHNINSNFDTIEISGTYDQLVRTAINVIAEELFQEGLIPAAAAVHFAALVRVADPTDSSVTLQTKPSHIDWVAENLSQEEFADFADWNSLKGRIQTQAHPWITLFEETEQRISQGRGEPKPGRVSRSSTSLFALPDGVGPHSQEQLDDLQPGWLNRYRYELPYLRVGSASTNLLARPLSMTQLSIRHFRGSRRNFIAAVPPDLAKLLRLERDASDFFGLRLGDDLVVRSTEWQEAFDQGRRRHLPVSRGFLLEMDRAFLKGWLEAHRLSLWMSLEVERSITQYCGESQMDWGERSELIEINFPHASEFA
jgi:hypothetical protein